MNGFESSIVIHRPIESVFALLADLEHDAEWRREWVESKKTSEGPLAVGSTFRLVGRFLGRRFDVLYEMTEYEPNRVAAWRSTAGPLPLTFRRTFEREDDGTRVTIRYDANGRGLLMLFAPLFARMGRRQLEGDFPRLKELMASS